MIELSRVLVRQFRAVARKSVLAADPRGPCPVVVCRAGRRGLTLSCRRGEVGVRHHTPGSFPDANVAVPFAKLAHLENAGEVIALEQTAPSRGRASWQGGEGLRVLDFDTEDPSSSAPAPESSRNGSGMEPGFLAALDEAARTASRDAVRFATNRILLRGRDGTLVATDGRQLLLQGGFRFPWKDDRYLPALPVFGGRELPRDQAVTLGLLKGRITLEVGPWLFDFGVEDRLRFPDVERVLPNAGSAITRLRLDAEDVEDSIRRLPSLPGHDNPQRPVTLDLGETIVVRSRSEKGEVGEVLLSRSRWEGPPLRVVTDRRYLLRALKLGFTEILVADARQPLSCKDAGRTYLWMPLSDSDAVPAVPVSHADPVRTTRRPPAAHPETTRSTANMPANEPRDDGRPPDGADRGGPGRAARPDRRGRGAARPVAGGARPDEPPGRDSEAAASTEPGGRDRPGFSAPLATALTPHRDPPTPALLITPDDEEYTMNHHYGSPDPPRTLAGRLERLNDNLRTLGERLKASIAGVVGDAIADAVRDAVRGLLGSKEVPADPYRDHRDRRAPAYYQAGEDDPWAEEDHRWEEEDFTPTREAPPTRNGVGRRWRNAMSAAVQAALWFLRRQPRCRPVLTTLAVTLAAGVTGFVAGPALAAGAGVLASVAGLLLTADASQSAAELAAN